jgi:hypothetical protein
VTTMRGEPSAGNTDVRYFVTAAVDVEVETVEMSTAARSGKNSTWFDEPADLCNAVVFNDRG